ASTLRNADIALHGFYRDSSQFLLGGLVQFGTDTFSFDGDSFAGTDDRYYAGAEAQWFLGDATLYGQAGAQQVTFNGESAPGWFATFEARYFLQPDFKIEAHVGANDFSTGGGDFDNVAVNSWNAGVGAEYKFANAPFSIFAKYDFTHEDSTEFGNNDSFDDNRFLVGVKFNFGAETLEDRDRSGASLKPVSSPAFAAPEEAN
ncbi:MAG: outer membrane beta-barrel protein, partial [Devosia sp.]